MRKMLLFITMLFGFVTASFAQSDYYIKKAQSYQREAEYYQKKAEGYRREASYYLKKAEGYQREAAYYTKRGDIDRAKTQTRYAEDAIDKYKTQLRYASIKLQVVILIYIRSLYDWCRGLSRVVLGVSSYRLSTISVGRMCLYLCG